MGGLPFIPHLSLGSSVLGLAVFRLCSCTAQGWYSAPWQRGTSPGWRSGRGWRLGSRQLAPRRLRSSGAPCGPRWGKGGRPALQLCGAAVLHGEKKGSSVDGWTSAGTGCPTGGAVHGQGRGLTLLALAWSGWGNRTDPS